MQRAIVGLLVGGEQEGDVARGTARRDQQAGRRTLDVAGAQPDRAVRRHAQRVRIGGPVRRAGHRIQVHVEHARWLPTHREHGHRTGAVVGDGDRKPGSCARR